MERIVRYWGIFCALARSLGPYALVEIVLPGGTLLALLIFLYRRKSMPWRVATERSDRAAAF